MNKETRVLCQSNVTDQGSRPRNLTRESQIKLLTLQGINSGKPCQMANVMTFSA